MSDFTALRAILEAALEPPTTADEDLARALIRRQCPDHEHILRTLGLA